MPTRVAPPSSGDGGVTPTAQPAIELSDYWALLREAQRRVRTSPDHLPAHIERLASAGDIEALVKLLRNHVAVLPSDPGGWLMGQRWGPRGVLRARMGTPREIAQLLADTLTSAGTPATVVRSGAQGIERPVLVSVEPLPFETDLGPDDLFAVAGTEPIVLDRTADPDPAAAMAAAALAAVDTSNFRAPTTPETFGAFPDVRLGDRVAGLWTAQPGPFPAGPANTDFQPIPDAPPATFTLSVATALDPRNPVEVATASFPLDRLAGRRVDVAFVPPADSLPDLLATRPADVTTVIPTLRVAGLDLTEDEASQLVVAGDPFTIEGDVFTEDGDGFALGNGRVGGSGDPSSVADIRINRIIATHYPRLIASIDVVDSENKTVPDVSASSFRIDDDGFDVPFLLRRTDRPAPRISFIMDPSLSVAEQFRGAGAVDTVTGIATAVKAVHPDAAFRITHVSISGALSAAPWEDDPIEIGMQADDGLAYGSALWNSYVDAALPDANVIVFITDGFSVNEVNEPIDEPPPELLADLKSGPPAIMLGSGELGPAFQGIADLSGGVTLDIADQEAAIAAVLEQIAETVTPYEAMILADEDNPVLNRSLTVRLADESVAGTAEYEVPPADEGKLGRALAGIYLRVQANGMIVDRTLAGLPYRKPGEATPELVQEVRQALFGRYSVITEAGAPNPSQVLDDAITELLTWEDVFAAADAETALQALAAAEELPHGAFTFSIPVSGEGPLTWDTGLRMWLSSERTVPAGDVDILRRSIDLLPVTRFVTSSVEAKAEALRLTATRTASLAAIEAAAYDSSAVAKLGGDLTEISIGTVRDDTRDAFEALANGWPGSWRLAFNEDLDAAVAVDPLNATLIAVREDGSGGAVTEEEIKAGFKQAIALTELYGTAGFKVWASLEKAKLEKLRFATLVIYRMSIDGILETIREEACRKIKKELTAWSTGAIGRVSKELEGMIDFYIEKAKEFNRYGDAIGLPPGIPKDLPVC